MAMFENSQLMDQEIERLVKTLEALDPTSDDYTKARINLNTLYALRNAQYKVDMEDLEKRDKSEAELKQKAEELNVRKDELESTNKKIDNEAKQKQDELEFKRQELTVREKELELSEKRIEFEKEQKRDELESANKKIDNEAKQKQDELEFKRQELKVKEREIALAEKRLEFEERQKSEENDLRTYELQLSEKQHEDCMKTQKKDRITNCAITAVNVIKDVLKLGFMVGVTMYVAKEGYKFEETGTPTSKTFREELKNIGDIMKDSFRKG